MASRNHQTPADIGDRHRHLLAFALLAIGVGYGASAVSYLLAEPAAAYLDWVQVAGTLIAVALVLPIVLWKLRHRSADLRHLYFSPDGFVAEAVSRAQKASWEATFVVVILAAGLDETIARLGLPPAFFLEGIVALMAGVFSLSFLFLNRVEGHRGPDEMEDVSHA